MPAEISIVVPVFNEERVLFNFHKRLSSTMRDAGLDYEVIYINDGSGDNSLTLLQHLRASDARLAIIDFSRNFGKESAMTAGLEKARGQAVVVIDCDLQDPPELIPEMCAKWREGYDVVLMKRSRRLGESFLKKLTASLFYKIFRAVCTVKIPENVGDFRLLSRKAVDALKQCPEGVRFMKGLFAWLGFKTATIEYERQQRSEGHTSFNYRKLWNFALDGFTSFSAVPLRMPTYLGAPIFIAAIIYGIIQVFVNPAPSQYTIPLVCLLLLSGFQMIGLGIMGEYLSRLMTEVKCRPLYIIQDFYAAGELCEDD